MHILVCNNIYSFNQVSLKLIDYHFPLYSVRVSNELGKGDAKAAEFSVKVISSTSVSLGVFFWILCLIFGRKLAYLFTSDVEVIEYVSDLYILLSLSILLNCVQAVLSGMCLIIVYTHYRLTSS